MAQLKLILLLLVVSLACISLRAQGQQLSNPNATPEARALLAYLNSIRGKGIVTGQHNYPYVGARWTDMAFDLTGKYPGLFGGDFGFSGGEDKDSVLGRPLLLEEVKRQYEAGAIIALTWHEVRPSDEEPVTFTGSVQAHLSDYEWKQLLTPGTPLNRRWCDQVDVVAGYLRQLRDAHIPVLFRPYHEMNGGWFWWGGRPGKDGSAALYRMIHDRFVNVHHLDNLVWVWNLNAPNPGWPAAEKYYPGAEYVDVVSLDVYGEFKQEFYEELVKLAGDKPLALAEVGKLPALKVLEKQPRWTYYMVWSEFIQENNPIELSRAVTHAPIAINRDDVRLSAPMEAIRKSTVERTGGKTGPQPVTEDATATVRETLQRLSDAREKGVLSGARKGAAETGKEPVIFAAEPGTGEEGWKSVLKLAQEAQAKKKIVELSWRPTRPDDGMATPLSDYEWKELLTPGSELYQKWAEGVDAVAEQLKRLNADGVAVMWAPYPEPTRKDQWWGGRHGLQGSSALYRQLFDRLVRHDGVKNLIWVWQTGASVDGALGLFDYFPGLLYVDAVELNVQKMDGWPPVGRVASLLAAGKPVGVNLQGELPQPDAVRDWSWFLAGSDPSAANRDALTRLLQAPHVVTLSEPK